MLLTYKNEIAILYSGECRNTYFEIKRSGGNDEQIRHSFVLKLQYYIVVNVVIHISKSKGVAEMTNKFVIHLFCFVRHFRHSFWFRNMYYDVHHYIILQFYFYKLATSKPEEGWSGQPKYCFKYITLCQPCSSLLTSRRFSFWRAFVHDDEKVAFVS